MLIVNIRDPQTGAIRKLLPEERLCTICDSGLVEDEKHFIFDCNKYHNDRTYMLYIYCYIQYVICTEVSPLCKNDTYNRKLNIVMNNEWRNTLKMIVTFWNTRKAIMYR